MTTLPSILKVLEADLSGNLLIEASAGTGKTYTITTLVLRLLLGLNGEKNQPLTIDQILIVTFTNAATAELKERIFKRIVGLKEALLSQRREHLDEILQELIVQIGNQDEALTRLILAERQMDQAAIFTIHGFCQRILTQNAFSAGLDFTFELNNELDQLLDLSCQNFWRKYCYFFSGSLAEFILQYYGAPSMEFYDSYAYSSQNLKSIIKPYIQNPKLLENKFYVESTTSIETLFLPYVTRVDALKIEWKSESQTVKTILERAGINRQTYSSRNLPNWLIQIDEWAEGKSYRYPDNLYRFGNDELQNKTKKGEASPIHPLFEQIDELIEYYQKIELEQQLTLFAAHKIHLEFTQLKALSQQINFDDILIRLDAILQKKPKTLIEQIQKTYQAVMIDEFQDTDYYQFGIFKKLFFESDNIPFIMIGDPKQSIYKFRGADIFAYLEAKKQVDKVYTLDTNYRSTSQMIDAVNTLFSQHENPFLEQHIPFYSVKTPEESKEDWLEWDGSIEKGITFLSIKEQINNADYLAFFAEIFANEAVSLLKNGRFCSVNEKRKIEPKDITFLVRGRREAEYLKKALLKRDLNAVYLSDRSNVFASVIANDLYILLNSLLNTRDFSLIKQSFASLLYGLSVEEYLSVLSDNIQYEAYLVERQILIDKWSKFGILGMIRYFMMQRNRLARLRALEDGERLVTDLFHVAELLQNKKLATQELVVSWFKEAISQKEKNETYHQRLESDFEAIKILTIHKSKGLEFPVVFIPFSQHYLHYTQPTTYYDEASQTQKYDSNPNEEIKDRILKETYAEALRLLYVAITRSKYHCRLGFAENLTHGLRRKSITAETALGYLLRISEGKNDFSDIFSVNSMIENQVVERAKPIETYQNRETKSVLVAATLQKPIITNWRFTSFSHLSYQAESTHYHQEKRLDEREIDQRFPEIITFPKGTNTGNFIHELLESHSPQALQDDVILEKVILSSTLYETFKDDLPFWVQKLKKWLENILFTEIGQGATLSAILDSNEKLNELEFLFPLSKTLTAQQVNRVLDQHSSRIMPAKLNFNALTGMLKGFIDLTFTWQNKFYIADYKTNFLGDLQSDYSVKAMEEAINHAYYDWQYLLYTVALVKYLRLHNPSFNYDNDFGGVYYLFLRGMQKGESEGIYFVKPEYTVIQAIEALFD